MKTWPSTDEASLQQQIVSLPNWHYEFTIGGIKTPAPPGHLEWHAQRAHRIEGPLLSAFGGSLTGCRVLDLGCNSGFWSLFALEAGCDHVFGVDAHSNFIEQAELVFRELEVDPSRYSFEVGDVFDLDVAELGTFDVVLCLGLLYHVSRPVELMGLMSVLCRDVLVIDTQVNQQTGSTFEFYRNGGAVGLPYAMRPSRSAVEMLARASGFTQVEMLQPYENAKRESFLCSKVRPIPAIER